MTKAAGNLSLKFSNHTSPAASEVKNHKCHTLNSSRIEPDACKRGNGHGIAISLLAQHLYGSMCLLPQPDVAEKRSFMWKVYKFIE